MRRALGLSLAAALSVTSALAQGPAARPLPAPNAEFAEPLSGPLRIVELRDGRLLVHDTRERRLGIANIASGEFTDVAREGSGPTEFRSALALLRAAGDSIWLYDLVAQRVLVIDPTGKPVRTQPFSNAGDPMAMMNRPMVREHDGVGRAYGEVRAMQFTEGRMILSDSTLLVRSHGARVDTLAKMPNFTRAPTFGGGKVTMTVPGFVPWDAWGVFADGRVLRVRGDRYVPEIYLADGTTRMGAAIPFPSVAVTAADRAELMREAREQAEQGMRAAQSMAGNQRLPQFELLEPAQWQSHKPPLAGTVILVDSRQRAWVPVLKLAGDAGERFDLLDADGRLVGRVTLPRQVTLLGFGNGVVYTQRKDDDDLLWIQRHPLP